MILFLVLSVTFAPIDIAQSHGGGLDSLGCHHDRKRGDYHCHQGDLTGRSFSSKSEALLALKEPQLPTGSKSDSSRRIVATIPYDRDLYGGWIDQDGDCQNTRQEVLIEESPRPVILDTAGCKVVSGRWEDPYTGLVFTDPSRLDIDHFIPLAEVHRSGGHTWTPTQRRQYANDLSNPDTLIAVSASANRSKRDKYPPRWLPPNKAYHCEYLKTWFALKSYWGLSSDPSERKLLATSEKFCPE